MNKLNGLDITALLLSIIGGINWLLVGLIQFDVVAELFGVASVISRIVYILVGLSAVYLLISAGTLRKRA